MDEYRVEGPVDGRRSADQGCCGRAGHHGGRMDENLAERVSAGDADAIALGRTLWPIRDRAQQGGRGRIDEIMLHARCASCEDPVTQPHLPREPPLAKSANPAAKPVA